MALGFARWLVSEGHRVTVYCADARVEPDGVVVERISRDSRVPFFLASGRISRRDHDVTLGFGRSLRHDVFRAGGGCHAAWMRRRDRTPADRLRRAWSFGDQFELRADRLAQRQARIVVCNSELAANDIEHEYGISRTKLVLVRNGVDARRFAPDAERRDAARAHWRATGRVALFLGSGFERKGLETALCAFDMAGGAQDRLVVIGGDRNEATWRSRAEQQLGDRLVWMGPRDDPERWLPGADAVVLPTRYDPSANSTLEAMSAGVPPVTTRFDGASEVVPFAGLVAHDPHSAAELADALRYAWSLDAAASDVCRRVAGSWPVSRMCHELFDVLQRVSGEGRR